MKKVYLFACIEKNIGDDLFIYTICKRYPYIKFIISSSGKYLKQNDIKNLKYSSILMIWIRLANIESNKLTINLIEKIVRTSLKKRDSVYIVGNAFKNMNYSGANQLQWLEKRLLLSKKFYLLSTNFGPTNSNLWKKDCENVFKKMTDICFRDKNSFEMFKHLNQVRYAPDAILTTNIKKYEDNLNEKYIIISVIDCSMIERGKNLNKICEKYENYMAYLINKFNQDNIDIILLNSNEQQDKPASLRIYDKCKYKDKIKIYNYDGNIDDVFKIYSNAIGVIATRLHTIILSWLYKIPVIPIIYDIKIENLLKSYNFNGYAENMTEIDEFNYDMIKKILFNYSFVLSNEIIKSSKKQFAMVDNLLLKEEKKYEK